MTPPPTTARRPRALALVLVLVGSLGVVPATAQTDDPGLGGYTLLARGAAIEYTYASPGLLPTGDIIFQVAMPESLASLTSGPTGYALSSLAWPGPLLADLGVIVEQSTAEDQRPPFRIPAYPVRAEAFNPQGPTEARSELVPGARMRAFSEGAVSEAEGNFTGLAIPLLFDIGGVTSEATSLVENGIAITRSRSELSSVSILAGLIQIESIITELEATSDGVEATATGSTTATGVTFAGLAARLDEDGLHLVEEPSGGNDITEQVTDNVPFGDIADGLGQVVDPIDSALASLLENVDGGLDELAEQSGIHINLYPTVTTVAGAMGEASTGGLQIRLDYDGSDTPVFTELLSVLPFESLPGSYDFLPDQFPQPPFTPQALALLLKEQHINTISVGTGLVSANAAEGFVLPPFDFASPAPAVDVPPFDPTPGVAGGQLTAPSADTGATHPLQPQPSLDQDQLLATQTNVVSGRAIGGAIVVGILLAIPLFGRFGRRLADLSLSP